MPNHVDVPEEAVLTAARRRHPLLGQYHRAAQEEALREARADLDAAAPAITAKAVEAERERLLSEESLEAMRLDLVGSGWDGSSAICGTEREGLRDDLRSAILAALDQEGDTDGL